MAPKEFIIKKFELRYPELVELVNKWIEHSIIQDWKNVQVLIGNGTIKNAPESKWSEEKRGNELYLFLKEIAERIQEYLSAKGYPAVAISYPVTLLGPDDNHYQGWCVTAYTKIPEELKSSK